MKMKELGPPGGGGRVTAPDRCYYLNQASLTMFMAGLERGKTNRSQTATDVVMVIKQSPGSWSHLWSLSSVNVCGSTSLFWFLCRDSPR